MRQAWPPGSKLSWFWAAGLCVLQLAWLGKGASADLSLPLETLSNAAPDAEELTQQGFSALHGGRSLEAARVFTLASALHSNDGSVLNNLATSLAILASEQGGVADLMCEALAAGQLALALGYVAAAGLVSAVRSELPSGACEGTAAGRRDAAALLAGPPEPREHLEMANSACSNGSALAVRPTARETQAGIWTAQHMLQIWILMRVCGVVMLDGVIPQDLVASVQQAQAEHFAVSPARVPHARAFQELDAASRGELRQEVKLPLLPPFTDPRLCAGPLLRSVVKLLIGERAELDTFSYIESAPGSPDQAWHSDAPTPREQGGCHSPPVGVVAVVPLTHMDEQNGATEFLAGSHVDMGDQRFWMAEDQDQEGGGGASGATPRLQLAASAGSAVLFDLRLRHRGRGNGARQGRAVLYTSYVQDWFRDGVNFKDRQTRAWDDMPDVTRRLFARLDGREYVKALEDALAANGVNVADLTSVSQHQRGKPEL